MKVVVPITD